MNNIRSVPPAISKMRNLTRLDLSRNGILCMHSTDYSGLPADMEKLVNLVDLRLCECNFVCIPPVIWRLKNLLNLDLSRNLLNTIPPEIGNLTSLRTLNLKRTNISTLPPEIAYCQELEILLLWGNQMEELPETISDIPNLKVLAINYRNFSRMIDSYREVLLCRGQIISEHIPTAVFQMRAIESLNLEATKINVIPSQLSTVNLRELNLCQNYLQKLPKSFFKLIRLEILDLSRNLFHTLPERIGQLKSLRKLYFSNNLFEKVPVSLCMLDKLEELDLSKNRIRHVPKEIGNLLQLNSLVLRNNNIQSLPEDISKLTNLKTLDVGENCIRELPLKMSDMTGLTEAHTYHKLHKYGLWVDKNPLQQPPPKIWRTTNTQIIFDYLKRLKIRNVKDMQQLKVILIGESQSGKTCLKNVLVNGWSDLTTGSQESTRVLDTATARTPNGVKFTFYDLGCDQMYAILWPLFLDSKSLTLVVYNHSTYTSNRFFDSIGRWLQLAWFYMPETTVKITGTHSETMTTEQVEKTLSLVKADVSEYIERHRQNIQKEMAVISSLISASDQPKENLDKKLLYSRQEKLSYILQIPKVQSNPSVVSCDTCKDGVGNLVKELETLTVIRSSFPHIHQRVHSSWHLFRVAIKKRTDRLFLSWEEILEITEEFPPLDHDNDSLYECLRHLHNTGEILWYSSEEDVSQFIFHQPQMFANLLADLFRNDLSDWLTETNKVLACRGGMSAKNIAISRDMVLNEGRISRPLLKSIWFYQRNIKRDTFNRLLDILPLLNICYKETDPDLLKAKPALQYLLVIPWFCKSDSYSKLSAIWPSSASVGTIEKRISFKFPFQMPVGLFEIICASLQVCFHLHTCWLDGAYGETDSTKVFIQKITSDAGQGSDEIQIQCRGFNLVSVTEMLHLINQAITSTLARAPGLYYFSEVEDA